MSTTAIAAAMARTAMSTAEAITADPFAFKKGLSALFFCTKTDWPFYTMGKGCGIMNQINYDRQMQAQIESLPSGSRPTLLLHSCCGPAALPC